MQKLAIIGGSYLQVPLVKKAKEMGIETHCFSWEDGADCRDFADYFYPISIVEKEQILRKCRAIGIDGICSIGSDVAVTTWNYVADRIGLIGNNIADTHCLVNKFEMRRELSKSKLNVPKYYPYPGSEIEDVLLGSKFPLMVKPQDRSGSRGVSKVYSEKGLVDCLKLAISESFCGIAIIEEFVEGEEVSVESISWNGFHYIIAITDKVTTGEPHFVETEHHQPSALPKEICDKIKASTLKALNALGVKFGASHTEIKMDRTNNPIIIEVGGRMAGDFIGSHLTQLSTGYDYLKEVINIALGKFNPPSNLNSNYSGVYFLSKETSYLTEVLSNWEGNDNICEAQMKSEHLNKLTMSSDRSGYLIYQSPDKKIFLT